MTDEQPSPDSLRQPDSTLPLPTEPLPPWGQASVPQTPYEPALVAPPPPPAAPPQSALPASAAPAAAHNLPVPAHPQPILVRLGEVGVSATTIYTPAGEIPLHGSHWLVVDQWQSRTKTPTWAIVCAIVLFPVLCFLSLFFLLAKDTYHVGVVQVTVTNGARQYVARLPVMNQQVVQHIHSQVNYVRSLAVL